MTRLRRLRPVPVLSSSLVIITAWISGAGCEVSPERTPPESVVAIETPTVPVDHEPLEYRCLRASSPPVFDGVLDAGAWASASWTADFRDIEGDHRPRPHYRTRAKMLWD
ncbi:MAG: hypothetical protein GY895_15445, partial [Phycisphaera sp.]|nr:hypothetical protein [Phycisphaera sp.]